MQCTQYVCQHHTVIGCKHTGCFYYNGAELRASDLPNVIVIDDPLNDKLTDAERQAIREKTAAWFDEVMETRLSQPESSISITSVVHKEDALGSQA